MIVSEIRQAELQEATAGLARFDGGTEIEKSGQYVFVYPDFGSPDGYPEHTAHRFHVVTVIRATEGDSGAGYVVRASDGWSGEVDEAELFPFDPTKDLDLPEGLTIETDEDGVTEDGSIAIKRALIDCFHANGVVETEDMSTPYRNLAEAFPEEYGEVCEEFERAPASAYR